MPTIKKPNQYFDATLYTGNGSTLSVTNAGSFQPDAVWLKCRSTGRNHNLFDSNRGTTKRLNSNLTDVEDTASGVTAFNSNGFTLGSNTVGNTNADTYVAWQWKAGGATTVNTSGTISSNVSVNTTAGFSIVTYTGTGANATVGHGLGVAPAMVIVKNRGVGTAGNGEWQVYHASLGNTQYLALNTTAAAATASNRWNNTSPTSSVFTVATTGSVNDLSNTYVAYLWSEIEGYSKFGSYTGNGNASGPFVYTGFRPKFVVIKKTSGVGEWAVFDGARETFNPEGSVAGRLRFNTTDAESGADSAQYMDFLSNGFKIRNTSGFDNDSGGTYVYMAFAEAPFKYSNAR